MVLPAASGPGAGRVLLPWRVPKRAARMSPGVRGRAGCRRRRPARPSACGICAAHRDHLASRRPRQRPPGPPRPSRSRAAARRAAPGTRTRRGQQQPGCRVARLRAAGGVERPEVRGRGDRELLGLPFPQMDRALRADLGRCLAERGRRDGPGVAADDPRRVRLRSPVQPGVLRVQVLLAFLAVGDPRGCHRPVNHRPDRSCPSSRPPPPPVTVKNGRWRTDRGRRPRYGGRRGNPQPPGHG